MSLLNDSAVAAGTENFLILRAESRAAHITGFQGNSRVIRSHFIINSHSMEVVEHRHRLVALVLVVVACTPWLFLALHLHQASSQFLERQLHLRVKRKRQRYHYRRKMHCNAVWFMNFLRFSTEKRWRRLMRLSKPLFYCVSKKLGQILQARSLQYTAATFGPGRGRPGRVIEHTFGAVLYQLAHGTSSDAHTEVFGISPAAFSRYRKKILRALRNLREEVIFWPDADEYNRIKVGFQAGPPGTVRLPGVSICAVCDFTT